VNAVVLTSKTTRGSLSMIAFDTLKSLGANHPDFNDGLKKYLTSLEKRSDLLSNMSIEFAAFLSTLSGLKTKSLKMKCSFIKKSISLQYRPYPKTVTLPLTTIREFKSDMAHHYFEIKSNLRQQSDILSFWMKSCRGYVLQHSAKFQLTNSIIFKRTISNWKRFLPLQELDMLRFMESYLLTRRAKCTKNVMCFIGLSNSSFVAQPTFGSFKVISRQSIMFECKLKKVMMERQTFLELFVTADFDHVIDPHCFAIEVSVHRSFD
jgi:hypothetical protein